ESGEDVGVAVLSACAHDGHEETRTAVEQRPPVAQARRAAVLPAVGLQRGVARRDRPDHHVSVADGSVDLVVALVDAGLYELGVVRACLRSSSPALKWVPEYV